ncbi:UTP--glucose-1-phosphate uridylyltransferase [Patescibacteria group bacterium]
MKITKAVIPAAGIGTRFLPWSKAMPKEMLPIVDKPVIQYVVEECVNSGIKDIIIVTSYHKRAIEDYFDSLPELERHLEKQGKTEKLEMIRKISHLANFIFIRQKGPYGNASPVLSAKHVIGNDPFAVLWGDQFVWATPPRLKQCLKVAEKLNAPVIAGLIVPDEIIPSRGMCDIEPYKQGLYKLKSIIEKPSVKESPSKLAAYGTYVLTPDIIPALESLKPGKDGELWLVDAINEVCKNRLTLAVELKNAKLYDAGNKLIYHRTVIDFMLKDKEIGKKMLQYLKEKVCK